MRHDMEGQIGSQAQPEALSTASDKPGTPNSAGDSSWVPAWPPQWPEIQDSLEHCYRSGEWGRYDGQATHDLAERLAALCQRKHCRLVSSGSLGIEIALRTCGVGAGDEVIVCSYDYPGNFRAIESVGARPVLVDAAATNYSAAPEQIVRAKSNAVKAVILSHLYGLPAEIEAVRANCDAQGWTLIEDACQVPGMTIAGRSAGSWGHISVFSFGGSKPLTAGRGGAIVTDDEAVVARCRSLLDRPSDATAMSPLQAAAVLPQLDRLSECNAARAKAIEWLSDSLSKLNVLLPDDLAGSTFYKLAIQLPERDQWLSELKRRGLPIGEGYRSMHRSSDRRCRKVGSLERSQSLGERLCVLDHRALLCEPEHRERLVAAFSDLPAKSASN